MADFQQKSDSHVAFGSGDIYARRPAFQQQCCIAASRWHHTKVHSVHYNHYGTSANMMPHCMPVFTGLSVATHHCTSRLQLHAQLIDHFSCSFFRIELDEFSHTNYHISIIIKSTRSGFSYNIFLKV